MTDDLILTFDLGTTRLKVALFDMQGRLVAQTARRNVDEHAGTSRWQSADRWWRDCIDGTRQLISTEHVDTARIKGVSLSGRASAAVFVDNAGKVIGDPWSDNRHSEYLRGLLRGRDRDQVAMYGATLLAKAQYLQHDAPDVFKQVRHVLYAKDFLLFRLTGECATDPSSGPDGPWDAGLVVESGIPPALLPIPRMPWEIAGSLTPAAANDLGLAPTTPVAIGAHDGICANTGAGSVVPGQYAITLGTHAVVRAITDHHPTGALRFYGYPPDLHVIGGNALYGGRALDWLLDTWFDAPEEGRQALFAELDAAAASISPGAGGVMFLPFLGGQIAPQRRPGARAAFYGMELQTTREQMYRAAIEGVSFALADIFEQVRSWAGEPTRIGVTGSGAASRTWTRLLADLTGYPLELSDNASEGRGAAIFCAMALGVYPSLGDAVGAMVKPGHTVQPDPNTRQRYDDIRRDWQSLARSLQSFDKGN